MLESTRCRQQASSAQAGLGLGGQGSSATVLASETHRVVVAPSPSAGDLKELARVPLRGEGSCGGGGAPRDSAGSGATEEGLTSRGSVQFSSVQLLSHVRLFATP